MAPCRPVLCTSEWESCACRRAENDQYNFFIQLSNFITLHHVHDATSSAEKLRILRMKFVMNSLLQIEVSPSSEHQTCASKLKISCYHRISFPIIFNFWKNWNLSFFLLFIQHFLYHSYIFPLSLFFKLLTLSNILMRNMNCMLFFSFLINVYSLFPHT